MDQKVKQSCSSLGARTISQFERLNNYNTNLVINVDENIPFVINQSTDVEYEVKSVIEEFKRMLFSYILRVVIIFDILIVVLIFQGFLMYKNDEYYMNSQRVPVGDRLHELLDPLNHPFSVEFCHIAMGIFIVIVLLRFILFSPFFYLAQFTIRFVIMFGSAYFIRGFFVYMTTMPSCYLNCTPELKKRSFFPLVVRIIAGYMGAVTNCCDLILSGHTMFTVLLCKLCILNVKYLATKIVSALSALFIIFTIVACKYHYTVDVMFGIVTALLLHYFYYTNIDEYGVYILNKINNINSESFGKMETTNIQTSYLAFLLGKMEMVEERLILGQKIRALYQFLQRKPQAVNEKLRGRFGHVVHLFGADESDDLLTLYRGTQMMNFYYWRFLYNKIFKRKQNAVSV